MQIRSSVVLLISLFLAVTNMPQLAVSQSAQNDRTEKIRTKVRDIGVGAKARVEVKMRDDRKLKGHIESATDDAFTVIDAKTGASQALQYMDVESVKKPNKGLGRTTWIVIAAAATAAVIVSVTVLYPVLCDGGAGC